MTRTRLPLASLCLLTPAAFAQPNVSALHKFSWSENCGWMNWRDAGDGAQRADIEPNGRFLSGFVWMENLGFLNLGDGFPADGVAYANTSGADFGVNIDPVTGQLSGLAWSENTGWINFSGGALASPPPARPARCRRKPAPRLRVGREHRLDQSRRRHPLRRLRVRGRPQPGRQRRPG